MSLISLPVPSVIEGLSEKPPHLAGPGKFRTLNNFLPLDESGLIQRNGTVWSTKAASGSPDMSLVPIDFGGNDRYVATLSHDLAQIFFRNGSSVPVKGVTRNAAGTITGGTDPDFSYLDLRTPQQVVDSDSLRSSGGAWTINLDASNTILGTGPLKPLSFPDPGAINSHNYSELTHAAAGTEAQWIQAINGNIFQGIVKTSVYVNTEIDGGAFRVSNSNRVKVGVQDPTDGTTIYGVEFEFSNGFTSPPTVFSNTGNCTPIIIQESQNDFRLGAIFDGSRLSPTTPGNSLQVYIILDDGTATSGMYAGDFLFELEGARDELGPYAQPPETLKTTTIGNTVFVANPLIATRADRTDKATSLADVYGTRTFTGVGGGSNETSVSIADAGYTYVKLGAFDSTYGIEIQLTDSTGSGGTVTLSFAHSTPSPGTTEDDTDVIATALRDGLVALGTNDTGLANNTRIIEGEVLSSVIKWESKSGSGQTWGIDYIRSIDSLGEEATFSWHNTVSLETDLPLLAQDDTRVILTEPTDDDPTEVPPQVILRFVGEDSGEFGKGYWKEGVDYDLAVGFDATTLPYTLTRRVDDTSGTVTGNGKQIYFEWAPHTWESRIVGDDNTNDYPSFITTEINEGLNDRYITAIGYYQDRLLLCSGGDVILSAASRRSTFCRTTIQSLPDSERIDVRSSASTASTYFDALYAGDVQYLRSKRSIDRITFQGALSARTIGISPTYVGTSSDKTPAVGVYNGLCFPAPGQRADFLRYLPRPEDDKVREIFLTGDVPRLPGPDVSSLSWSSDYRMLFLHSRNRPNQILGCRFVLENDSVRQRSWTRLEFNGQVVSSLTVLDDDLFILVHRSDGLHIESLPLTLDPADADPDNATGTLAWSVRLDRRITENNLKSALSHSSGTTTIALPYDIVDASKMRVVYRGGSNFGVSIPIASTDTTTPGSHTISLTGDYTGDQLLIGEVAEALAVPQRPSMSQATRRGNLPAVSTRVIIRQVEVAIENSAWLDLLIRDLIQDTTTPATTGSAPLVNGETTTSVALNTDTYTASVGGRPEATDLEIHNGTHKPCNITGLEWKVDVVDRGGRISL